MARALSREELLVLFRKHGVVQSAKDQVLAGTVGIFLDGETRVLAGSPLDDERHAPMSAPAVRSAPSGETTNTASRSTPSTPVRAPEPLSDDDEDIAEIALRRIGGERMQPAGADDASRDIADIARRRAEDDGPFAA
jgi:hypothetical protein